MSLLPNKKKRKGENGNAIGSSTNSDGDIDIFSDVADYSPLSLRDMQGRIHQLCHALPTTVPPLDPQDHDAIVAWAFAMQAVIIEFNLLLSCISAATYKWGSDRSGAADQNLNVLSAELGNAQDQINAAVSPRLSNVLAPVVDLVIDKVVVTKEGNEEVKQNYFTQKTVDPAYVKLCDDILCRNAGLLRQVVLANFHKIHTCIGDYLKVTMKDSHHDDTRGFSY